MVSRSGMIYSSWIATITIGQVFKGTPMEPVVLDEDDRLEGERSAL